jgi:putative flippase GtrA
LDRLAQSPRARITKFVISGGLSAGVYFVLASAFMWSGLSGALAGFLAYGLAFFIGYGLQQRWTFLGQPRHARALPRYLMLQVVCAGLSTLSLHLSATVWGAPILLSSFLTTLVLGLVSYMASSRWVFADE